MHVCLLCTARTLLAVQSWLACRTGLQGLTGCFRSAPSPADYLEPDWQGAYWGAANYARLQAVKAAYDPANAFTCHHCVELPAATRSPAMPESA